MTWARSVTNNAEHTGRCDAVRESARPGATSPSAEAADAPDLRWPGYVGTEYVSGGVLCISNVHTRFQSGGLAHEHTLVSTAIDAHRRWSAGELGDEEWLPAVRSMYEKGLSPGGWTVASGYREAWRRLGETARTVAYVNAARCQWFGTKPPAQLYRECLSALPLEPLIQILQPRLVLTTSPAVFERWHGRVDFPVVYFHQMFGTLVRELVLDRTSATTVVAARARSSEWARALVIAGYARTGPHAD